MNGSDEAYPEKEEHIGRYVNRLSKDIRYSINGYLLEKGYSMTGEQCRILGFIRYCNDSGSCVYQKDIENSFGIKRSSVASILANMEKGGYIIREVDKSDARIKKVFLTDEGQKLQTEIGRTIGMIEEMITRNMSDKEKRELIRLTQLAISNIESSGLLGEQCGKGREKFKEKETSGKC
ncbi:MAG: MarR family winged helix-turn-helix transcriptional regulator [Huintestinicola sp.]|uniref:MarR family winged helix-turn-helix transcriptional regulator n=1 Tax=Huintestinicola sp. TaxID=2981661 RepID=UPI003F006695